MQVVDSWRLFGPNLQTKGPAALSEVAFDAGEDAAAAVDAWRAEVARMASELGVHVTDASARLYRGGAVLTFSAPLDVLLPMTDLNEWAAQSAASALRGEGALPLEPQRTALRDALAAKRSPRLLALEAEALARRLPMTWDDDAVTVGAGATALTWAYDALPAASDVPWDALLRVPLALVTGTNGKTTSVRLLARLAKHAGRRVGMTTTDGVWVDEALVVPGDYTGPAGARAVLSRPDIDAAILETARGGILRRGLAVRSADVALLTNVSDDHLGHYGIDDLTTLARVKAVVGSVIPPSGRVVVQADDAHLMAEARSFVAPLTLFSIDPASPRLVAHRAGGGEVWTVEEGFIVAVVGGSSRRIAAVDAVPVTFRGAATYNVANALGAAAAAAALGFPDEAIVAGLTTFTSSASDNPGRGNLTRVRGIDVLVDFAHNPDGIRNVLALVGRLRVPAGRLVIVGGYAGDRSDASIRDAALAMADARPSRVYLRDLEGYLRGRAPGEVPTLLTSELIARGLAPDAVEVAASEGEALRRALDASRPGDFVVILAHLASAEVRAILAEPR